MLNDLHGVMLLSVMRAIKFYLVFATVLMYALSGTQYSVFWDCDMK